jgi:hypothetical protein
MRTGRLISRTNDSLTIEWQNGDRQSMPTFEIERIYVSTGRRHYVGLGVLSGLVLGAGVGLIGRSMGGGGEAVDASSPYISTDVYTRSDLVGIGALGRALLGGVVGAFGMEQWRSTALRQEGRRVGLVAPVGRGGVRKALSARV